MSGRESKTVLIGCGTGRCGTTSLTKLIGGCENAVCKHERRPLLPWIFNEKLFRERVRWFCDSTASVVGDVAYFYLPYLEEFIRVFPNVRIICLERERQAVIDSFMWKTQWRNRWYNHEGTEWIKDHVWDVTFPKYDIVDKPKAIGAYYDEYRKRIRLVAQAYPGNVQIFGIAVLNTMQGQRAIFDFLDIPQKHRRYQKRLVHNVREIGVRPWSKEEAFRWAELVSRAAENITLLIPQGNTFILVDQQQVRDYLPAEYRAIPFLERDGHYWGPPPDDVTAIRELDRLRKAGASFIVFALPAFWWLDYYKGLCRYLRSQFRCVIENECIVMFDLQAKGGPPQ
jgi:hypothetical protein